MCHCYVCVTEFRRSTRFSLSVCVCFVELRMRIEYTRWERVSATDHFKCQWTLMNIFQTTLYARLCSSFSFSLSLSYTKARGRLVFYTQLFTRTQFYFIQYHSWSCCSFHYFISLYHCVSVSLTGSISLTLNSWFIFLKTIKPNVWFIQKWSTQTENFFPNLQFHPFSSSLHTVFIIIINIKNQPNLL